MKSEDPTISIIVPYGESTAILERVVGAIAACEPPPDELVLVGDGTAVSPDVSAARNRNITLIQIELPQRKGPAAARNAGAAKATADWLLFVDADVMIPSDTIALLRTFIIDGGRAAVSIPDADPPVTRSAAKYKNAYMRLSYLRFAGKTVPAFLTSAAMCRRSNFIQLGGFDENYQRPSVEDAAFGRIMRLAGIAISVIPGWEIGHAHDYSTIDLIKTAFLRAAAVTRMILREGTTKNDYDDDETGEKKSEERTSPPGFRTSMLWILAAYAFFCFGIVFSHSQILIEAILFLIIVYWLNRSFLTHLRATTDVKTLLFGCFFLPLDLTCHVLGVVFGGITYTMGKRY